LLSLIYYLFITYFLDQKMAAEILPKIPQEHRNRIAQFLDSQGFKAG
jgi:hypothetical protein